MSAQPITCDLCSAELAAMLVTNLGTGDTMGIGARCMFTWASSMAATFDPANVPAEDGPATTSEAVTEGERVPARAPRPRGKAKRPTVVPDGPDDTGAETAADVATAD